MGTMLVREVSKNYRGATKMGETLREPAEVAAAFRSIMTDNSREHFMALFLNGSHQTIAYSVVSTGTATAAPAHPRAGYQPAILVGAAAIVIGSGRSLGGGALRWHPALL